MKLILFMTLFVLSTPSFAQKKVAVVKMLRGEVDALILGKTLRLKAEDWVEDGSIIKTAEKSFAKLVFLDKSQMNIGPNSEMKIEKFQENDAGVIDLVKGKIRSQVTKDYLQIKDKDKSKLFIKTPNAVMGIRGTDFMISTNGINTAAVLFEGEVVFNKIDSREVNTSQGLEAIVDKGVRMHPGEFSVVEANRPEPTVPALMNVHQRESLEKNQTFDSDRSPDSSGKEVTKSVVPAGLSGQVVSNSTEVLKGHVSQVAAVEPPKPTQTHANADGFVSGDKIKPANGSFVHIDSGVIIPPGPGSVLDANTNTYIPSPETGKISADGNYVPPKNVEITNDGKIFIAVTDKGGATKVHEIEKPLPVKANGPSLGEVHQVIKENPTIMANLNPGQPVKNDILNANFAPSGLNDLSNFRRNQTGGVNDVNNAAQQFEKHLPKPRIIDVHQGTTGP